MYNTTSICILLLLLGSSNSKAEELKSDCPDEQGPCPRQGFQFVPQQQGFQFVPQQAIAVPQPTQPPQNNQFQLLQTILFYRILGLGNLLKRLLGDSDFDHEDEGWYEASNDCFYKYFTESVQYAAAKSSCEDKDARLASKGIYTDDVRQELVSNSFEFPNGWDEIWIGFDSFTEDGTYYWSDGLSLANDDGLFSGIDDGLPTENCGALVYENEIDAKLCGFQKHYLCEHCP